MKNLYKSMLIIAIGIFTIVGSSSDVNIHARSDYSYPENIEIDKYWSPSERPWLNAGTYWTKYKVLSPWANMGTSLSASYVSGGASFSVGYQVVYLSFSKSYWYNSYTRTVTSSCGRLRGRLKFNLQKRINPSGYGYEYRTDGGPVSIDTYIQNGKSSYCR